MTERYNTNNPVPSNETRDFSDNARIVDEIVHLQQPSTPDRFGVPLKTWFGVLEDAKKAILSLGWHVVGTFQTGAVLNTIVDIIQDEESLLWYRWDDQSTLPKTVPPNSTPESTGGIGDGLWVALDTYGNVKSINNIHPDSAGNVNLYDFDRLVTTKSGLITDGSLLRQNIAAAFGEVSFTTMIDEVDKTGVKRWAHGGYVNRWIVASYDALGAFIAEALSITQDGNATVAGVLKTGAGDATLTANGDVWSAIWTGGGLANHLNGMVNNERFGAIVHMGAIPQSYVAPPTGHVLVMTTEDGGTESPGDYWMKPVQIFMTGMWMTISG